VSAAIATRDWVGDEARALLARVARVRPLIVQESMTPAAAAHPRAQRAIEGSLRRERTGLMAQLQQLLRWLTTAAARRASGAELQARLIRARLQFTNALSNLDLFADALSQRSERDSGLWLAGLDAAAEDALAMPGYYEAPPVLCYLDRGPGAAIRRARTRLPGGGPSPIALIQIPRERMTGTGVAASLAHETGHQAAALLQLVESLRRDLGARAGVWALWDRWISEIVADLWATAKLGPTATMGLMGALALPPYFVYRASPTGPHPPPWLRVHLTAALGQALYPDPQWQELAALWSELYPLARAGEAQRAWLAALHASIGELADRLLAHRCRALAPRALGEALALPARAPAALAAVLRRPGWLARLGALAPAHALAVVGQARWARAITPEAERRTVSNLLATWAIRRTLDRAEPRKDCHA
jgi:hypothetical protein